MAGIMLRGNHPLAYVPGMRQWYGDAYARFDKEYVNHVSVMKSNKYFEDFVGSAGMGLASVLNEGGSIVYDDTRQGIANRLTAVVYAKGFMISNRALKDQVDGPKLVEKNSRAAAIAMAITKETICANVLNNGFDTAVIQNGGDGKPLFSATHKLAKGGTYSNLVTAADLSEASLETAIIQLAGFTDDAGLLIKVVPDKLIINVNDVFNAERILKSPLRVGTTDNDVNAIRSMGMISGGAYVNHYLTDTDAWFITTNMNSNGVYLVERESIETDADTDFDTKSAKFSITESYVAGWADARGIIGSAGV